jgi:hypothetical protein
MSVLNVEEEEEEEEAYPNVLLSRPPFFRAWYILGVKFCKMVV